MNEQPEHLENEIRILLERNDPNSLELLWRHLGGPLFGYLFSLTGNRNETEEIMSDLFVKIAEAPGPLAKSANLRAYLFTMARNQFFRKCRETRRTHGFTENYQIYLESRDPDPVPEEETRKAMEMLESLPLEQREVVVMKIFQDMTFAEIAGILGESLNTVASRYRYAMQKMKMQLEAGNENQ